MNIFNKEMMSEEIDAVNFKKNLFYFYVYECLACIHICMHICAPGACPSGPLDLGLQRVVSHSGGAGNQSCVFS